MRIGFTGAGGTGKTATLEKIPYEKFGMTRLSSVARQVFVDFKIDSEDQEKALSGDEIFKLQKEIFTRKMEQEHSKGSFISDRTLLDTLVYILVKCNPAPAPNPIIEALEVLTKAALTRLDMVIFFPIEQFWRPDDGMRDTSLSTALLVDATIRGLLVKFGCRYILVGPGSAKDRADRITGMLENRGKKTRVLHGASKG